MKKTITLLVSLYLISVSISGQTVVKLLRDTGSPKYKSIVDVRKSHEPRFDKLKRNLAREHTNHIHQISGLKSTQTVMQRLDSLLYEASGYGTYRKEEYTYDVKDNVIQYADYDWDYELDDWIGYAKAEYTYNSNDNMTLFIHYYWDETASQWIAYWKEEYTNDAAENWIQTLTYIWNDTTSQWVQTWKDEYAYDENNNLTQMVTDEWNSATSQWDVSWKEEYTYNTNNDRSQIDFFFWDDDGGQWLYYAIAEYNYDTNNNLTHYTYSGWDDTVNQWLASWNEEYTYDPNNNMTLFNAYEWDEVTSEWILNWNEESTYDDNQNRTQYISFIHADTSGYKSESYYDNSYATEDLIFPFLENEEDFRHMLLIKLLYYWDKDVSEWIYDTKITYYYSEQNTTGMVNNQDKIIKIYPNPANDFIVFEMSGSLKSVTFILYDMMGKEWISQEVINSKKLNIKHLNSGMYFYDVYINGTKQSGKLIIK
jgi:hypothetical protein